MGNSLVVQWLRLGAFVAVALGLISGQRTKFLQAAGVAKKKKKKKIPVFESFQRNIEHISQ